MGTTQLLFIAATFVLFGYFVIVSNQRTEILLVENAKQELFGDMITIGDYANEYYLSDTSYTYSGFIPPLYLFNRPYTNISIQVVNDSLIHFTGSSTLEPGVVYERMCTPSGSLQLIP